MRASLGAAIFRRWPVPATSQESETRGLRDGGRSRGATQLAPDVRDVPVNGMRAQHELPGDLAIAETARDAGEDLTLTTGQQVRLRFARMVRRRLRRCQRFAARADDGIDITVPGTKTSQPPTGQPATMTFDLGGRKVTQTGSLFTVALRKVDTDWCLSAWAWAKGG